MSQLKPVVYVVDDDVSVRDGLRNLLRSVGLGVKVFKSIEEFDAHKRTDAPICLILDVRLPGLSGLQFQEELNKAGSRVPVIFITAHGDIPMSVRAMKGGACEFFTKPFNEQELLHAIHVALTKASSQRDEERTSQELRRRYAELTVREQEVLPFIVSGRQNKQIAAVLGLSEITVKVHRGNIMRKMQADSREELVRMTDRLGIAVQ